MLASPDRQKRVGANRVVAADRAATKILGMVGPIDACSEFAPTTATWATMTAVIRPPGRIISAALVSEPVPLNQQCLTATGVTLTGTSVGTRKRELLKLHELTLLTIEHRSIASPELNQRLVDLAAGKVTGRMMVNRRQRGLRSQS